MLTPDAQRQCPICGNDNGCMAGEKEPCWCQTQTIPSRLLAKIPAEKRGKACICRSCVLRDQQERRKS